MSVRHGHFFHARAGNSGDQAGASLVGQVAPTPVYCHREAAPKPDQEINVRHAPEQPGDKTGKPEWSDLGNRAFPADRR